jgi:hypothetical protein
MFVREVEDAFTVQRGQKTTAIVNATAKLRGEDIDENGRRMIAVDLDLAVQSRGAAMSGGRSIWSRNEVNDRTKRFIDSLVGRVLTGGRVESVEIEKSGPLPESETGVGYQVLVFLVSSTV